MFVAIKFLKYYCQCFCFKRSARSTKYLAKLFLRDTNYGTLSQTRHFSFQNIFIQCLVYVWIKTLLTYMFRRLAFAGFVMYLDSMLIPQQQLRTE